MEEKCMKRMKRSVRFLLCLLIMVHSMDLAPFVFAEKTVSKEQQPVETKEMDLGKATKSELEKSEEAARTSDDEEIEAVTPSTSPDSFEKPSENEQKNQRSEALRAPRMSDLSKALVPYINANTADYSTIISPLMRQITGSIAIGKNVGDKASISQSNNNGYRRFFSFSDGFMDYWITARHFATVTNFRSLDSNPGFKGTYGVNYGKNDLGVERLLSPTTASSFEFTYEPQLEVTKLETYFKGTPNLFRSEEGYSYYKGDARKIVGEMYMPTLSMTINGPPSVDLILGSDMTMLRNKISERLSVSVGGSTISQDAYDIFIDNTPTINKVGEQEISYTVKWKQTPEVSAQGKTKLKVAWGSTIAMGGLDNTQQRTTAAFTLQSENAKNITISQGNSDDNYSIHHYFSGKKYYSFDWFDLKNLSTVHLTPTKKGNQHIEANGDELKQEALKKWQPQPVNTGDIVHAWTAEGKQYFTENEQLNWAEADNYYEVTNQGFKKLTLNQLKPSKQTINYGINNSELDKNIGKYLDTSKFGNLTAKKFVTYPDTSQQGDTKGTIQIEETTTAGKKLTYDYDVPFTVERLTAKGKDGTSSLGQSIDWKNYVQEVQLNGQNISQTDYSVTLLNNLSLDTIGKKGVKLRISLKSDPTNFVDIDTNLDIKWGTTIKIGGIELQGSPSDGRSVAAFSLQTGTTKVITATQGNQDDNYAIHDFFAGKKYYSFDWFDLKNRSSSHFEPNKVGNQHIEASGDEFKQTALKRWKKQTVSIGDVVNSWMPEERQYLYGNEKPVYHGRDNYYEITNNGFKLLNLNKLKVEKQSVNFGMSQTALDDQLKQYLDTSNYNNIVVKKFVKYPETDKQGATMGTIQIEETATSGKKLTYDYEVPFSVDSPEAATADAVTQIVELKGSLPDDAMKVLANIQYDGDKTDLKAKYNKTPDTSVMGPAKAEVELSALDGKKTTITIPVFVKDDYTVVKNDYAIQASGFTLYNGEVKKAEESNRLDAFIMNKSLAKAWNVHTGSVETKNLTIVKNDIQSKPGTYKVIFALNDTNKEIDVNVLADSELVDMTVPVATKFAGIDVDKGKVKSPKYKMTNNSSIEVGVSVSKIQVKSNSAQIKLLEQHEPDPTEKENTVKLSLSLSENSENILLSMVPFTTNQPVYDLLSSESGTVEIKGRYFGDFSAIKKLEYQIFYSFDVLFDS